VVSSQTFKKKGHFLAAVLNLKNSQFAKTVYTFSGPRSSHHRLLEWGSAWAKKSGHAITARPLVLFTLRPSTQRIKTDYYKDKKNVQIL